MNRTLSVCLFGIAVAVVGYGCSKLWSLNAAHIREKREQDQRLANAQRAVEEGRPIGEPPAADPAHAIEPKIVAAGRDQRAGGDRYAAQQKYLEILAEIKALPESDRKQQLFYTLAYYQAQGGFYNEAAQTANLMTDREQRINYLIAAGSNHIKEKDAARQSLLSAAAEIAQVQDTNHRDSLYAQLAFAQHTRGLVDDQKMTCSLIITAEYKNGTCKP